MSQGRVSSGEAAAAFSVIGKPIPKRDGQEKVTGFTQYLHDLTVPRMLHGAIFRTRFPHARIRRIDTSRARALPGVVTVITAEDVEQQPIGLAKDHLPLKGGASDGRKARCIRDEIAAVAAESPLIAQEALEAIEVEYEELPGVFSPEEALRPGAPLVHEALDSNLVNLRYQFAHGDVDAAFSRAAAVAEGAYRLNYVSPAALGTMAALASWSPDGALTMWSTTQVPFLYQKDLAEALGITGDRVRVIQPPIGGSFGRGLDVYPVDVITALLARKAGRPVKIAFERVEDFIACPTREPCEIRLRTAADAQGRLLGRDVHVTIDNGAYVSWGSTTPYVMLSTSTGLYRCPAVRFDTTIVYTNNPYSGSMRGYGNLEITFAVEAQMDDLADRLGMDRVDFRRLNANQPGDITPQGSVITSCGLTRCLDAVEREIQKPLPQTPEPGWKRGVGFAGMFHVGGGARVYRSDGCGAILRMDDFGQVTLLTGASEIGQGSETVLAMIVAEELQVPLDRVSVVNSDTAVKPWDVGCHASRTTFVAGNAALRAARELKRRLLAMAAELMDEPPDALELVAGMVRVTAHPERGMEYDRVVRAGHLKEGGRTLVTEAFYDPPTQMLDKNLRGNVSAAYGFAAQAVLLEVSESTGQVRVLKVASAHDVGRTLNPLIAEGQIHGGIHMGLGYALAEELVVREGQVLNPQFMEYPLLVASDMPDIVVEFIETVDEEGPFGAKGLGEAGVIPVSAAVANAVKDAVGARLTELPLRSERIFQALQSARQEGRR